MIINAALVRRLVATQFPEGAEAHYRDGFG